MPSRKGTRVRVIDVDDGGKVVDESSLADFLKANEGDPDLDRSLAREINSELRRTGSYTFGGGAAPLFRIEVVGGKRRTGRDPLLWGIVAGGAALALLALYQGSPNGRPKWTEKGRALAEKTYATYKRTGKHFWYGSFRDGPDTPIGRYGTREEANTKAKSLSAKYGWGKLEKLYHLDQPPPARDRDRKQPSLGRGRRPRAATRPKRHGRDPDPISIVRVQEFENGSVTWHVRGKWEVGAREAMFEPYVMTWEGPKSPLKVGRYDGPKYLRVVRWPPNAEGRLRTRKQAEQAARLVIAEREEQELRSREAYARLERGVDVMGEGRYLF